MKTKKQILKSMEDEMPFELPKRIIPYLLEAMEEYRNQPSPYQPGQKSPTAYLEEAWKNDSKDEMSIAVRALTAQAQAHAEELEAFCEWLGNPETQHEHGEHFYIELLPIFRASRSGKKTEG